MFEEHPNPQTVPFAGKFVNLSAIARSQAIDHSYLSRIFAGKRTPSLNHCKKIAAVLGMTIDQFLQALETRVQDVKAAETKVLQMHANRIAAEDTSDLKTLLAGRYPAPRLPALRSA